MNVQTNKKECVWAEDVFPSLEKFKLEKRNSEQFLNGNVSVAVFMAPELDTGSRSNQMKKKNKTEEETKIVIYTVRQDFSYNLTLSTLLKPLLC